MRLEGLKGVSGFFEAERAQQLRYDDVQVQYKLHIHNMIVFYHKVIKRKQNIDSINFIFFLITLQSMSLRNELCVFSLRQGWTQTGGC